MKQFKFWLDNKVDKEFTLDLCEIKEKFTKWMEKQSNDWLNNYFPVAISAFIANEDGLNSVMMDMNEQRELSGELNGMLHSYLDTLV